MTDRRLTISTFLAQLEATKGRGVIAAAFPSGISAWAGPDSDVPMFECALCGAEIALQRVSECAHCGGYFCRGEKDCYDRHADFVRGERWG